MWKVNDKVIANDKVGTITSIAPNLGEHHRKYMVCFGEGKYNIFKDYEMDGIGDRTELNKAVKAMQGTSVKEPVSMDNMLSDLQKDISEKTQKDRMLQLRDSIAEFKEQERRLEYLKEKTKEQSQIFNRLSQSTIPDLLLECGMDGIDLAGGQKVKVSSGCTVKIEDEAEFFKYLENKGGEDDAMIKDVMTISNPSKELKKIIREQLDKEDAEAEEPTDTDYDIKRGVNTGTLKAYCLREVKKGTKGFPPSSISLFIFKKTKIK